MELLVMDKVDGEEENTRAWMKRHPEYSVMTSGHLNPKTSIMPWNCREPRNVANSAMPSCEEQRAATEMNSGVILQ